MKARIQLYLRGEYFNEMEINLPDYLKLPFNERVELRKLAIDHACGQMKVMYTRQLIKRQFEYEFFIVIESRMNGPDWLSFKELDKAV